MVDAMLLPRWLRVLLIVNGALVTGLGIAWLVVGVLLPHLVGAGEQAQGVGLFDPRAGADPALAVPRHQVRSIVAFASLRRSAPSRPA